MQVWKVIDDSAIRHVWCCASCDDKVNVTPLWYQVNGTPVCTNCDTDMEYLQTEIDNA